MTSPDPPTWEQAGGHVEWLRQRAEHHDRCSDAAVGADGAVYHAGYARELSACAAEIERLREALDTYGNHVPECGYRRALERGEKGLLCSCGYTSATREPSR